MVHKITRVRIPKEANVENTLANDTSNAINTQELKLCLKFFSLILQPSKSKYSEFSVK